MSIQLWSMEIRVTRSHPIWLLVAEKQCERIKILLKQAKIKHFHNKSTLEVNYLKGSLQIRWVDINGFLPCSTKFFGDKLYDQLQTGL